METQSVESLLDRIQKLEARLEESEQLIEAIKAGEVDAFAVNENNQPEIYTLQSGDYAYRILIEEFGEGALNISEDGLIVYTNSYFAELLQLPYEKVIGMPIYDFIHKESAGHFRKLFTQALTGRSKGEINLCIHNKSIPVYISLTSLQPKLATVGIIITDQTEKKKNEEVIIQYQKDLEAKNLELAQNNIELASFTYIASHDLQEPLRKIQTFSNRIMDKADKQMDAGARDYFQRIVAASKRMQNLISSLLTYSRMNTGSLTHEPVDLNEIVEDVLAGMQEQMEEYRVEVMVDKLPVINGVPLQFTQLFTNLLSNAIKYRSPQLQPLIRIEVKKIDDPGLDLHTAPDVSTYWKITVADNGIGFEPQYAEKIFELFQRLHTKFEYEGTGIGLAICKKIVQNHKGCIKASGNPEGGSIFEIYLPDNSQL